MKQYKFPLSMSEAEVQANAAKQFASMELTPVTYHPVPYNEKLTALEWHAKFCEEIDKLSDTEKTEVMAIFGCAKKVAGIE